MANGITFDKLEYVVRLQASGFSESQVKGAAEALDVALKDTVATKYDIARLEAELSAKIALSEGRLRYDLTLRMGAIVTVGVGVLAAMRFFG